MGQEYARDFIQSCIKIKCGCERCREARQALAELSKQPETGEFTKWLRQYPRAGCEEANKACDIIDSQAEQIKLLLGQNLT